MNRWPYEVKPLFSAEIGEAVRDEYWQAFRQTLKGLPTTTKLDKLKEYRDLHTARSNPFPIVTAEAQVQIDNYLNALKRGGLINDDLEVVR